MLCSVANSHHFVIAAAANAAAWSGRIGDRKRCMRNGRCIYRPFCGDWNVYEV